MHGDARVGLEPLLDGGAPLGAVVVADQVNIEPGRDFSINLGQELLKPKLRRRFGVVRCVSGRRTVFWA